MGLRLMKQSSFLTMFFAVFVGTPLLLAWSQGVPARSTYQHVVLYLSLAAFGLLIGQFWLSRLLPRDLTRMKPAAMFRWHRVIGYTAGGFLLVHPVLMIARRFWVEESDPIHNLLTMLQAPAMLPAIGAWILLVLIIVLALVRRRFPARKWRVLHGLLSAGCVGLATWHAVATGRHSNPAMAAFWIGMAAGAVTALLLSYRPARSETRLSPLPQQPQQQASLT